MPVHYKAGLGNVGSYQVAGRPWLTGAAIGIGQEHKIEFPYVAKAVTIVASGSSIIRVHFNSTSSGYVVGGKHYITLDSDEDSITFNVKCKEVYISSVKAGSAYQLFAELTGITEGEMYPLSGSGLTD